MTRIILALCLVVAAIGGYVLISRTGPADRIVATLSEPLGPESQVTLEDCTLAITVHTENQTGAPMVLVQIALRADLRLYTFDTVRIAPRGDAQELSILRRAATDAMEAQTQTQTIITAGRDRTKPLAAIETLRDILSAPENALSFRVMAEVITEDGKDRLIAHADAPEFFRFAEAVKALPDPTSHRVTTTFSSTTPAADTLLTGEVIAIPVLQFRQPTTKAAEELARAFYEYAQKNRCF